MRKLKKNTELEPQYSVSSTDDNPIILKPSRCPPKSTKEWDQTIEAFEEVFSTGASDPEAILYVQRKYPTLNAKRALQLLRSPSLPADPNPKSKAYLPFEPEDRADIIAHFEELQNAPLLAARHNIIASINEGDLDTSKWYLERKAKNEFSSKHDATISAIVTPAMTLEERDEMLSKIFDKYRSSSTSPSPNSDTKPPSPSTDK